MAALVSARSRGAPLSLASRVVRWQPTAWEDIIFRLMCCNHPMSTSRGDTGKRTGGSWEPPPQRVPR